MQTIGDLRARADDCLIGGQHAEALSLYTRLVSLQQDNLDARLRIADALVAIGEVQRAAVVYTELARHSARSGYPLRALVALKVLATLEPQLGVLVRSIAALYASGSQLLGRGVRRAPPDPDQPLPNDWAAACETGDGLSAHAETVARDYAGAALIYPEKLIPIPLLSLLPADEFTQVLQSVRLVRARPAAAIIEEGAAGSSFFVLARGSAVVSRRASDGGTTHLATLHDGAIFGELSLLTDAPRSASVTAQRDCDLLEFDRNALLAASSTLGTLTSALGSFAQERLLKNVLSTAGVFKPLDYRQRQDLIRRFVAVHAEPGQVLIQEGQAGAGLFVILRGEVAVSKDGPGGTTELARLGPGEAFGEISLLNDEPTTATVAATVESTALMLGKAYFERLVEAMPAVRDYLEQIGEDRQMDTRISMEPPEPALDEESGELEVDVEVLL